MIKSKPNVRYKISTLIIGLFCIPSHAEVRPVIETVSIIQLIATPEKFHGKKVRIMGAARLEFEGDAVCVHVEDLKNDLLKNCLWIEPNFKAIGESKEKLNQLNNQYVLIEGTFSKINTGHFGLFSGAIEDIYRYKALPKYR